MHDHDTVELIPLRDNELDMGADIELTDQQLDDVSGGAHYCCTGEHFKEAIIHCR